MIDSTEKQWQAFEELGEKEVRQKLADQHYGEERARSAKEWLNFKERQRADEVERRNESSRAEELDIARDAAASARVAAASASDAADSARISAKAAKTQAKIAIAALVIGIISLIISVITILRK